MENSIRKKDDTLVRIVKWTYRTLFILAVVALFILRDNANNIIYSALFTAGFLYIFCALLTGVFRFGTIKIVRIESLSSAISYWFFIVLSLTFLVLLICLYYRIGFFKLS